MGFGASHFMDLILLLCIIFCCLFACFYFYYIVEIIIIINMKAKHHYSLELAWLWVLHNTHSSKKLVF